MQTHIRIGLIFIIFAFLSILILLQPYMALFIIILLPLAITYLVVGIRYIKRKNVAPFLSISLSILVILASISQAIGLVFYPLNYFLNPSSRIPLGEVLIRFIVVFGLMGTSVYNIILINKDK